MHLLVVVAFRGTRPTLIKNWADNLKFIEADFPSSYDRGKVHSGFLEAYQALSSKIYNQLQFQMKAYSTYNIVIVGHSLGGAQATIMAMDLFYNRNIRKNLYLITLGSPRVGDSSFAGEFQFAFNGKSLRLVHALDIVPHVPPRNFGNYMHVPREIWESSPGVYHVSPVDAYEESSGSDSVASRAFSVQDHMTYLGISLQTCTTSAF
jgi:predicted lipase